MSAVQPLRRPQGQPAAAPRRAPLHAVEPRRRPRPNFLRAAIVLGCLGVIFGAQLLLSIIVSSGQYEIAALQSQQKELDRTADALQENLQLLSSTQNLAQQAAGLGMVQGTDAAFLRLSDGAVIPGANPTQRYGCTGSCGLVANELLVGMPQVQQPQQPGTQQNATQQTGAQQTGTQQTATQQAPTQQVAQGPATDTIPAPVTR